MTRIYTWHLNVRSYEGDAWGFVPASGVLRYFEQVAVAAAADGGYGVEFHREQGTAWIVRRVTMLMHAPARYGDELEITTWASHFVKVRGGREYKICNARTGELLFTGITEWVYVDRATLAPRAIPPRVGVDFDVPGAPQQRYDQPVVADTNEGEEGFGGHPQTPGQGTLLSTPEWDKGRSGGHPQTLGQGTPLSTPHITERVAEWSEVDSNGHVNNAHYADWLDDAVRVAMGEMGQSVEVMQEKGVHLRGEYYSLNYRRAVLAGDRLRITTRIESASERLYAVRQEIAEIEGRVVLEANSVYGWRENA